MAEAEDMWRELQRRANESSFSGIRSDSDDLLDDAELREGMINPNAAGGKGNQGGQGMMPPMMMGGAGAGAGGAGAQGAMGAGAMAAGQGALGTAGAGAAGAGAVGAMRAGGAPGAGAPLGAGGVPGGPGIGGGMPGALAAGGGASGLGFPDGWKPGDPILPGDPRHPGGSSPIFPGDPAYGDLVPGWNAGVYGDPSDPSTWASTPIAYDPNDPSTWGPTASGITAPGGQDGFFGADGIGSRTPDGWQPGASGSPDWQTTGSAPAGWKPGDPIMPGDPRHPGGSSPIYPSDPRYSGLTGGGPGGFGGSGSSGIPAGWKPGDPIMPGDPRHPGGSSPIYPNDPRYSSLTGTPNGDASGVDSSGIQSPDFGGQPQTGAPSPVRPTTQDTTTSPGPTNDSGGPGPGADTSYTVNPDSLRNASKEWDQQSDSILALKSQMVVPTDFGFVKEAQAPFSTFVDGVTNWASEAGTEFSGIGVSLRAIADNYETTESANVETGQKVGE